MKISPSILDADFSKLGAELDSIKTADRIHLDVMDHNFVPNLSFGYPVLKNIKFPVETEAHLMVENPEKYFDDFSKLDKIIGITFHIENTLDRAVELLKNIQTRGLKAGITVNGKTDVSILSDEVLEATDKILLMSVQAGFGGQAFMPEVYDKIKSLRSRGFKGEIEVDGGCTLNNAAQLKEAGADILVVGSFLMKKPAEDRAGIIEEFQGV